MRTFPVVKQLQYETLKHSHDDLLLPDLDEVSLTE